MKKKFLLFTLISALVSLSSIGCNKRTIDSNVIKIATHSPLSGGSSTLGESIKLGAELALEERKAKFQKLGFQLELAPADDQGELKKGVANAQQLAADQNILAIIGHLNSGIARAATPIYEKNKLLIVSPANTTVDLTESGWKTFHRVVARVDFQGRAAAQYAVEGLRAKNIYIIQDKTTYGQSLADSFKKEVEKLGAHIQGYEGITIGEKDFNGILNQMLNKKPDLVYFSGMYTEGALLIKQAREKGITAPFLGGEALDTSDMIKIAGESIHDTYYTTVAADVSKTTEGQKFVKKYKQKYGKHPQSFSYYGYDSMQIILKGLEDSIQKNAGKRPSRKQLLDAVHAIQNFQGLSTCIGFDKKGDNRFAKIFIFKFENQKYPGRQVSVIDKK